MLSGQNTDGNTEGKAASIYRDCRVGGKGSMTPRCHPSAGHHHIPNEAIRFLGGLRTYAEGTRAELPHSSSSTQPQPRSLLAKAPRRPQTQSQGQATGVKRS